MHKNYIFKVNDIMTQEIKIKSTSKNTADMSEIKLKKTTHTETLFKPIQVNNVHDIKKSIKGKLIFNKDTSTTKKNSIPLSKKDIKGGEYVEFELNTEETYNLAKGLFERFKIANSTEIPFGTTTYVESNDTITMLKELVNNDADLINKLSKLDSDELNLIDIAIKIRHLNEILNLININLENSKKNEEFWQNLFIENSWILPQIFSIPLYIFKSQPYIGGKGIDNVNGKITDYILKNPITSNISLIEIKKPLTKLMENKEYRGQVYAPSSELSGSISQILNQKDTLYKEYITSAYRTKDEYKSLNFPAILIIGNVSSLDEEQRDSFELFRNELKNIDIIGFDELSKKIEIMINILQQ